MPKPTSYAKILAEELRKRGIEVELEHNDGHKSVDLFIPSVKLDIEVDGSQHITDSYQALTDLKRTKNSLKEGRVTLRIPNTAIYQNVLGVADDILEIVNDLKSKSKKEKIEKLKEREKTEEIKNSEGIFNYSNASSLNNSNKKREVIREKKSKWKKYLLIGIIILVIAVVGYSNLNNQNPVKQTKNYSENNNLNSISNQPKIEPIVVTGSKTEVIIKNNQQKAISLNVTYKIYSRWFGKDSTESKVFEINAGEEKSFKVYNNDGCNTAPCSISILNFEEV